MPRPNMLFIMGLGSWLYLSDTRLMDMILAR